MRGETTLSATLEASNNEHQDIILTTPPQKKQYTELKRITGRRFLRCNHKLSNANVLRSVVRHTVQATLSGTLQHDWCRFASPSIFVFNYEWIFNFSHSDSIKIALKCMNETKKKRLQKVFTLHYWRFFFFLFCFFFLIQVFVFRYFVLLWYVYHLVFGRGGWNVREDTGQGVENRDPVIYERIWTSMCIFNSGLCFC